MLKRDLADPRYRYGTSLSDHRVVSPRLHLVSDALVVPSNRSHPGMAPHFQTVLHSQPLTSNLPIVLASSARDDISSDDGDGESCI